MVCFKNIELNNFLRAWLDKSDNAFEEEDLLSVEELVLSSRNLAGEFNFVDIYELRYFPNLRVLKVSNMDITEAFLAFLIKFKMLKELTFESCNFDTCEMIKYFRVEKLSVIDCVVDDESFVYEMKNLRSLDVVRGFLNFEKLNQLQDLQKLNISSSTIACADALNLNNLEEFWIDFSNITNLEFLRNLDGLKKLSASREQLANNQKIIRELLARGVDIFENNMVKLQEVV